MFRAVILINPSSVYDYERYLIEYTIYYLCLIFHLKKTKIEGLLSSFNSRIWNLFVYLLIYN